MRQSNPKVYIRDTAYAWLPGIIVFVNGNSVSVRIDLPEDWHSSTLIRKNSGIEDVEEAILNSLPTIKDRSQLFRTIKLDEYNKKKIPLQNTGGPKSDMADLPHLHEAAILYNIKARHAQQQPYTRVGDIVIAMNPFDWIPDLYSSAAQELYARKLIWEVRQQVEEEEKKDEEKKEDEIGMGLENISFGSQYDKLGFEPHVYEISCLAYRGLAMDKKDQTILVSGESGAGKTETVKIVLTHLATLELTRPDVELQSESMGKFRQVVNRVIQSSPVFEAFGNAKTGRNNNSSRFGKFTQLEFAVESAEDALKYYQRQIPLCTLVGSVCVTYLLEKSRVVSHSPGERSYHIFYQLLASPQEFKRELWPHFESATVDDFSYLAQSGKCNVGGWSDSDMWLRTIEALQVFDVKDELLLTLTRALGILLQLGNLIFQDSKKNGAVDGGTTISSSEELAKLSSMIGISAKELESAMTLRTIKTSYEEVKAKMNPSVAKEACDALAKQMYGRIFDFIVRKVNEETRAAQDSQNYSERVVQPFSRDNKSSSNELSSMSESSAYSTSRLENCSASRPFSPSRIISSSSSSLSSFSTGVISLLDIFGFECFKVNRFQQLCINYANEQLQQKYVLDNFTLFKEEYEPEGIDIFDFKLVDNSGILTLLERKKGIIDSLNEECLRPMGNEVSFVYKAKVENKCHPSLIDEKLHSKTEFGIKHFAGPVKYDASRFVEHNTDKLPQHLIECAMKSTNWIIKEEFTNLLAWMREEAGATIVGGGGNGKIKKKTKKNDTVLDKFRGELRDLMSIMEQSNIRYIRCIKPNESMTPRLTSHPTTVRQLRCAGLVTAITLHRESFPDKLAYTTALDRYNCLMKNSAIHQNNMIDMNIQDKVIYMFSNLLLSLIEEQQAEECQNEVQQDCDLDSVTSAATAAATLGSATKKENEFPFVCGKTKVFFRVGALEHLETLRHKLYSNKATIIQRLVRKVYAVEKFYILRIMTIQLQTWIRCNVARLQYRRKKRASEKISSWIRGCSGRAISNDLRRRKAAITLQCYWRTIVQARKFHKIRNATLIIQRLYYTKLKLSNLSPEEIAISKRDSYIIKMQQRIRNRISALQSTGSESSSTHMSSSSSPSALSSPFPGKRNSEKQQHLHQQKKQRLQERAAVEKNLLTDINSMIGDLREELSRLQYENDSLEIDLYNARVAERGAQTRSAELEMDSGTSRLNLVTLMKSKDATKRESNHWKEQYKKSQNEINDLYVNAQERMTETNLKVCVMNKNKDILQREVTEQKEIINNMKQENINFKNMCKNQVQTANRTLQRNNLKMCVQNKSNDALIRELTDRKKQNRNLRDENIDLRARFDDVQSLESKLNIILVKKASEISKRKALEQKDEAFNRFKQKNGELIMRYRDKLNDTQAELRKNDLDIVILNKSNYALRLDVHERKQQLKDTEEILKDSGESFDELLEKAKKNLAISSSKIKDLEQSNRNLVEQANHLTDQSRIAQAEMVESRERNEKELQDVKKTIDEKCSMIVSLEKSNDSLLEDVRNWKEQFQCLQNDLLYLREESGSEVREAKKKVEESQSKIDSLQKSNDVLAQDVDHWKEQAKLSKDLTMDVVEGNEKELLDTKKSLESSRLKIKELEASNEALMEDVNHWKENAQSFQDETADIREQSLKDLQDIQKRVEDLQEAEKTLDDCHLKIEALKKSNTSLTQDVNHWKVQALLYQKEMTDLRKLSEKEVQDAKKSVCDLKQEMNHLKKQATDNEEVNSKQVLAGGASDIEKLKKSNNSLMEEFCGWKERGEDRKNETKETLQSSNIVLEQEVDNWKEQAHISKEESRISSECLGRQLDDAWMGLEEKKLKIEELEKSNKSLILQVDSWKEQALHLKSKYMELSEYNTKEVEETKSSLKESHLNIERLNKVNSVLAEEVEEMKQKNGKERKLRVSISDELKDVKNRLKESHMKIVDLTKFAEERKICSVETKDDTRTDMKDFFTGSLEMVLLNKYNDALTREMQHWKNQTAVLGGENAQLRMETMKEHDDIEMALHEERLMRVNVNKSNELLLREIEEWKEQATQFGNEAERLRVDKEQEMNELITRFERMEEQIFEKDKHIQHLNESIAKKDERARRQRERLENEKQSLQEKYRGDIRCLQDDIKHTQESQKTYLESLMETLDRTNLAREEETVKIVERIEYMRQEKDNTIHELERKLDILRSQQSSRHQVGTVDASEINKVRGQVKKRNAKREKRSKKFQEVCEWLESALKPENVAFIMSKKVSVEDRQIVFDDFQRMMSILGELYEIEERSQETFDKSTLEQLDQYIASVEPNKTILKLKRRLAEVEEEKKKLEKRFDDEMALYTGLSMEAVSTTGADASLVAGNFPMIQPAVPFDEL